MEPHEDLENAPVGFGSNLGEMRNNMEQLSKENFDLKLQLTNAERTISELRGHTPREERRASMDDLYEMYDDNLDLSPVYHTRRRDGDDHYFLLKENQQLRAELQQAKSSSSLADRKIEEARREADRARSEAEMARKEAVEAHDATESLRISMNAKIDDIAAEHETEVQKALTEREGHISGITMQRDALQDALKSERTASKSLRLNLRKLEISRKYAQERVQELEAEMKKLRDSKDSEQRMKDSSENQGSEKQKLQRLQARLHALESQEAIRKEEQFQALSLPKASGETLELSVAGYELYQSLVQIVDGNDRECRSALQNDPKFAKMWRATALTEMNDALRALYQRTNDLEEKRKEFLEMYCASLNSVGDADTVRGDEKSVKHPTRGVLAAANNNEKCMPLTA